DRLSHRTGIHGKVAECVFPKADRKVCHYSLLEALFFYRQGVLTECEFANDEITVIIGNGRSFVTLILTLDSNRGPGNNCSLRVHDRALDRAGDVLGRYPARG